MKKKLMKISMFTAVLIFLFTGVSWADSRKNRVHNNGRHKHYKTDKYHHHAHSNLRLNKHHHGRYRDYHDYHHPKHRARHHYYKRHHKHHRLIAKHHRYHHKKIRENRHKHRRSYNVFSLGSVLEPGWTVIIKTKSRW